MTGLDNPHRTHLADCNFKPYGGTLVIGQAIPELAPAAGPNPPSDPAAGVSLPDPDYTAAEGDVSAEALGAGHVADMLAAALRSLADAQHATNGALLALSRVPDDDPSRHRVDHLVIEATRSSNELAGIIESLLNLGVTS